MDELQTIGPVVGVRLFAIDACAIDWASRWKLCTQIPRQRLVVSANACLLYSYLKCMEFAGPDSFIVACIARLLGRW
jgi:hypothetical protein